MTVKHLQVVVQVRAQVRTNGRGPSLHIVRNAAQARLTAQRRASRLSDLRGYLDVLSLLLDVTDLSIVLTTHADFFVLVATRCSFITQLILMRG